ncbi:hypothetical protein EEB13_14755 [Rhodococcus sp. WS3]|nr:hypothetical protein EEB13_14755 [Rhodococcus sp. WS3]
MLLNPSIKILNCVQPQSDSMPIIGPIGHIRHWVAVTTDRMAVRQPPIDPATRQVSNSGRCRLSATSGFEWRYRLLHIASLGLRVELDTSNGDKTRRPAARRDNALHACCKTILVDKMDALSLLR